MKTGNVCQDYQAQLAFIPGRSPTARIAVQSSWGPHNHLPSLSSAVMVSQPASFSNSPPLAPSQSHFPCLCLTHCCPCHSMGVGGTCAPVSSSSFLPIADRVEPPLLLPPKVTPLCNPLTLSMGRTCDLLLTYRIWQKQGDATSMMTFINCNICLLVDPLPCWF